MVLELGREYVGEKALENEVDIAIISFDIIILEITDLINWDFELPNNSK